MIAHVAEAGEDRGRVVLWLRAGSAVSEIALAAAVRVAVAYGSDLESLTVDDGALETLAAFGFVREVSRSGRQVKLVAAEALARDARVVARMNEGRLVELARAGGVTLRASYRRDEALPALASVCALSGPWNIVVLAEPLDRHATAQIGRLLAGVADATGLVVAGPRACRTTGPVLVAVDDLERLAALLRTASRLTLAARGTPAAGGARIGLVLMGEDPDHVAWMDAQARLAIGASDLVRIEAAVVAGATTAGSGEKMGLAGIARARGAGFVIARVASLLSMAGAGEGDWGGERHGEPGADPSGDLWPLAATIECPMLLMR